MSPKSSECFFLSIVHDRLSFCWSLRGFWSARGFCGPSSFLSSRRLLSVFFCLVNAFCVSFWKFGSLLCSMCFPYGCLLVVLWMSSGSYCVFRVSRGCLILSSRCLRVRILSSKCLPGVLFSLWAWILFSGCFFGSNFVLWVSYGSGFVFEVSFRCLIFSCGCPIGVLSSCCLRSFALKIVLSAPSGCLIW